MKYLANMQRNLYVIFFLVFQCISAQEINVLDADTKEPVLNVAVYNVDRSKTALSDFDGKTDLSIFDRNERITFSHIGYIQKLIIAI